MDVFPFSSISKERLLAHVWLQINPLISGCFNIVLGQTIAEKMQLLL
jgi:hypothetical protein